ncbi:hypothetical protein [Leptothoe sp. PORK10 BA2]|uniref:hypothetical protein n=1 Tax=Leptothoe sp. PORK10 BA2 TaxID=3110254 RepID=UPI002B1ECAA9|nr:hypothetical protein [Leptothoe sp. PORK10 BA2]MEA5466219.1 hypothetical protein [Leptothoe sp. PORK10 BA2]
MTRWFFTVRQRFTPSQIEDWQSYIKFSGFVHITEVVTLDSILCPDLIDHLIDEDWSHNIQADYRTTWFTDLAYLRQRISPTDQNQLLAILEQPTHIHKVLPGFNFCGFDILDDYDSNSLLTNFDPFSGIFSPSDVNQFGLLSDPEHANAIAAQLRSSLPDDPHCCNCRVWQIARNVELNAGP